MTSSQKKEILRLRDEGFSFTEIGKMVELSANTVQSFYRRQSLAFEGKQSDGRAKCAHCKKLMAPSVQSTRRFCGNACRMAWWRKHPEKRPYTKKATCAFCGKEFDHNSSRPRKFCSHACYGKSKVVVCT